MLTLASVHVFFLATVLLILITLLFTVNGDACVISGSDTAGVDGH